MSFKMNLLKNIIFHYLSIAELQTFIMKLTTLILNIKFHIDYKFN